MLFSTHTHFLSSVYGLETAVDMIIEAGFPAIDVSLMDVKCAAYGDGYIELAKRLKEKADAHGVIFNQAHAPFGGGAENYINNLIPLFPRVFEFVKLLGVKTIVVHPIHSMRYEGNEEKLFSDNVKFFESIKHFSEETGVKIGIENMHQVHPVTKRITDSLYGNPEELARMYDTMNDPDCFTVCLDLGHVAVCGREPDLAKIGRAHV